ncbi:MAG: hypothetical protein ACYTG5_05780 [Planctomycetota bacterium]|jgi:hypothetical protein
MMENEEHYLPQDQDRPEDQDQPKEPRQDGFPEEILREAERLEVSADFVDSCLQKVLADQQEIASEAARVDEVEIPREVLDAFTVPDPKTDFASRLAAQVGEDRKRRQSEWRSLLRSFSAPEPTRTFVDRTLAALRGPAAAVLPGPGLWNRRLLAAAAALVLAVGLQWSLLQTRLEPLDRASAQDSSPVFWGTSLQRQRSPGIRFESLDGLRLISRPDKRGADD